jgi:hypothetical protein
VIVRLLVLVTVIGTAWVLVWLSERVRGRSRFGLEPGLVLVTSEGCSLCGPAMSALEAAGRPFRTLDAAKAQDLGVRSVPTLFLVGDDGAVLARRSGRAAVMSPAELTRWS